jgi:hypothetical protein
MPDSGSAVDPIVIVFAVLGIILAGVAGFFITRRLCTFADGREPLQPILVRPFCDLSYANPFSRVIVSNMSTPPK